MANERVKRGKLSIHITSRGRDRKRNVLVAKALIELVSYRGKHDVVDLRHEQTYECTLGRTQAPRGCVHTVIELLDRLEHGRPSARADGAVLPGNHPRDGARGYTSRARDIHNCRASNRLLANSIMGTFPNGSYSVATAPVKDRRDP